MLKNTNIKYIKGKMGEAEFRLIKEKREEKWRNCENVGITLKAKRKIWIIVVQSSGSQRKLIQRGNGRKIPKQRKIQIFKYSK